MRYPSIARKLRLLGKKDQEARRAFKPGVPWSDAADRKRTIWLKAMVKKYGWPTVGMVGKTASRAAWLIAQHAGFNQKFQSLALRNMKEAHRSNPNDIELTHIAYLTDRILTQKGKPQIYGTQLTILKTGKIRPLPIKDRERLNARRKAMGLDSFEKYLHSAR